MKLIIETFLISIFAATSLKYIVSGLFIDSKAFASDYLKKRKWMSTEFNGSGYWLMNKYQL